MKITDPDVIKTGEKDLIDAIKEDLDLEAVKEILKNQIAQTALSAKGGQIIVHDNQIAFRLDFDLNLSGSLIFDRDGNYIPQSNNNGDSDELEDIDLNDINIDDALEEMGPESDLPESDLFEESEKELPEIEDETPPEDVLDDALDLDDETSLEDELSDIENEILPEDELSDIEAKTDEILPELTGDAQDFDLPDNGDDNNASDDLQDLLEEDSDDDIDDILQESREFWEPKEES